MTYTYISARYSNADETAAVAMTKEAALVAISEADRPSEWAALTASGVLIEPYVAPPASPARIAKNAIWERATDAEAEVMEQMLSAQPVRIRRIYEGATHISADHELFALLSGALTQAFGEERAAELLAPTE